MNVSATSAATIAQLFRQAASTAPVPQRDHDGDGDEGGVRAATAPGVGARVDIDA